MNKQQQQEAWLKDGYQWLADRSEDLQQAAKHPPTAYWKGVLVILKGVWQDVPEAKEFQQVLLRQLNK